MLQMQFFVRFYGQFQRTKPDLVKPLKDAVAKAAAEAGGSVEIWRKGLTAAFDESRIGFWLDILIFLEKIHGTIEKAAPELFGCVLVLGPDLAETAGQKLSQSRNGRVNTGIWCSEEAREALDFYVTFDPPAQTAGVLRGYGELREFKSFSGSPASNPALKKIARDLASSRGKNTLFAGTDTFPIKKAIRNYLAELPDGVPPLVVRFGAGGRGLICFSDAYTPEIRSFIAGENPGKELKEFDTLSDQLFKERLRDELSPGVKELSGLFFRSLLEAYSAAVKPQFDHGVVILEDLHLAGSEAKLIFREAYLSLKDKPLVFASDIFPGEGNDNWHGVFRKFFSYDTEDNSRDEIPWNLIPKDLCEAAYAISLLRRYFPSYLFPRLFEEEGLNREMYFRAVGMLAALGAASPQDPEINDFIVQAEKIIGERKEKIRSAVRSRILAWAVSGKLRPCFNLLRILFELGERAKDDLVLRSIRVDVLNGTWEGIDEALRENSFPALVGDGNAAIAEYIFVTLKALVRGEEEDIFRVFGEPPVLIDGNNCYAGYQAQIHANLAAFHIGGRNNDAASEAVRKAMILNRDLGRNVIPANRFFSLVHLGRQSVDDALEYISFAMDQAERNELGEELFLTCYYASSVNFLYGNLSKAERFALRAEETAGAYAQAEWGMRAGFLRGRICFETGRYREALDVFESLAALRSGRAFLQIPAMIRTVNAWIFRARNFLSGFSSVNHGDLSAGLADPAECSFDGRIFETEAAFFARDYTKAETLAGEFLSSPEASGKDFLFTERPDWRSGFSQCENLLRSEKAPGTKLAWVYQAMAQCAQYPSRETRAGILGSMQRFMREELLSDTDPFDPFYFYAWYTLLRNFRNPGDSAQTDINTVVSMALKRIQRRADRIDESKTKQTFLSQSRWTSTLYLAAREHKLI
jgi:hypothetical protein